MTVKRALISVFSKEGIVEFAKGLERLGTEIAASGGTCALLKKNGIKAVKVESLTAFPECLGGRVKTLHPAIHAGILANRKKENDLKELKRLGIKPIDLVAVNLYPFREAVEKNPEAGNAVENVDIGGVALLRAAAKNFESVAVVSSPRDYGKVLGELKAGGKVSLAMKKELAVKAFEETAMYDSLISNFFREKFSLTGFPEKKVLGFEKKQDCRYGENPHQKAAVYSSPFRGGLVNARQLQGKELSYNNFNDANAAVELAEEFAEPAAVIVKHTNPCGVAVGKKIEDAFRKAFECDSLSAFGGIIALNRKVNAETAERITSFFNEAVVAPAFEKKALESFAKKKNLRVIEFRDWGKGGEKFDFRGLSGGMLLQEKDFKVLKRSELRFVSGVKPSKKQLEDLLFAWKAVKHAKSNAVVVAKDGKAIGVGAGQASRVEAVEIALKKAGKEVKGAVLASDAFFPFKDSIELAAKHGISAVIEPGGSVKDEEVIKEANKNGIALLFTNERHFMH